MASQILEDSAALVDAMVLNVGGFTELDFDPRSEWAGLAGRPAKTQCIIITPRPIITIRLSTITRRASMRTQSIMQPLRTNTVNLPTNIRRPHIHILTNNDQT
jgi:hypothetical protein